MFPSTYLASLNLLLGGKQGDCGRPISHFQSRAEQIGGVTHYRQVSLGEYERTPLRRWQSAEDGAGVFLLREKQSCLLLRGLLCHLGLQFVGKGIIVMSRKRGIHPVPAFIVVSQGLLYFLSRHRDLKVQRLGQDD